MDGAEPQLPELTVLGKPTLLRGWGHGRRYCTATAPPPQNLTLSGQARDPTKGHLTTGEAAAAHCSGLDSSCQLALIIMPLTYTLLLFSQSAFPKYNLMSASNNHVPTGLYSYYLLSYFIDGK